MRDIVNYPYYEVDVLSVGDADAIILAYKENKEAPLSLVLVDAGNVGDSSKIQKEIYANWGRTDVDLAILTHPDKDHKGGFFGLLQSPAFKINEFWLLMPWRRHPIPQNAGDQTIQIPTLEESLHLYNHPTDNRLNLIRLLIEKGVEINDAYQGRHAGFMPLWVVGPTLDLADRMAMPLVKDFVEIKDDPQVEDYVEDAQMDDDRAKGVIDKELDDMMPANMCSVILFFNPNDMKFLLTGDASRASLNAMLTMHKELFKKCILKVPHHGSKHNLNTEIIDKLDPISAVISCAGTNKHPSNSIVYWLSKHCDVYYTKMKSIFYNNQPKESFATALKRKIQS